MAAQAPGVQTINTITLLERAYSRWASRSSMESGCGIPAEASALGRVGQKRPEGSRLSELARSASITAQAMSQPHPEAHTGAE